MADQVEPMQDPSDGGPVFQFEYSGCSARGRKLTDNRFLVYAGALGSANTTASFDKHSSPSRQQLRQELISDGTLEIDGERAVLTRNYEFNSPSAAGTVLIGRDPGNWLDLWLDENGKTLRMYMPSEVVQSSGGAEDDGQVSPTEIEFRRRWYEAHHDRFVADQERYRQDKAATDGFTASAPEALEILADLQLTGDVQAFKEQTQAWAVKPETLDFNGFKGQMLINQLVKHTEDPQELAKLLADSLTQPLSDEEAIDKIRALVNYVKSTGVGAPRNVPFVLSYFWGLANHEHWPVIWPSAVEYVEFSTGETLFSDPADLYRAFLERVRELEAEPVEFEMTAAWWNQERPIFLHETLCERSALGADPQGFTMDQRTANARAMFGAANHWGEQLVKEVSSALGRSMTVGLPSLYWSEDYPRGDVWVDWYTKEAPRLGIRVWVNDKGAAVAVRPGEVRKGWWDEVEPILKAADYPGCQVLGGASSRIGDDVGLFGLHGAEFVYGRWFDREQLENIDLAATVVEVSKLLRPLFEELLALVDPQDPLEPLVEEFRAVWRYDNPKETDEMHNEARRHLAELLAPDAIAQVDVADLRKIWNRGAFGIPGYPYGNPGQMSHLNESFRDPTPAEYDRMLGTLRYLCWGEDPDAERIDRLLDKSDSLYIKGLADSVIMKLLAITHPDVYLPVFPYDSENGKRPMLKLLELEEPTGSPGERHVASNRLLRDRIEKFFPGDPWGMMRFLYWYRDRGKEPVSQAEHDVVAELANELLVERGFLYEVIECLKDKGQVIFYGPPGTGKTYLARKLAEALAPDQMDRALVQFHPSSSYEDFFEGYRPKVGADGKMTYQLTLGPLAHMAERAANESGRRHVMVIDEINRANLPKVFGELLFLLEYRDESVQTLYRPKDSFELPQNLWFIGTMNTADRSIALVDAALRRRFHFIPFFPNQGAVQGLLERWIGRHHGEGSRWVWELVDQANNELEEALGGPHLLVGPSHFMKENLDVVSVRRIWQFNIEPFIEDQFFGDSQQIERFRFDAVYERYQELSGARDQSVQPPPADESVQAGGEGGEAAEGA